MLCTVTDVLAPVMQVYELLAALELMQSTSHSSRSIGRISVQLTEALMACSMHWECTIRCIMKMIEAECGADGDNSIPPMYPFRSAFVTPAVVSAFLALSHHSTSSDIQRNVIATVKRLFDVDAWFDRELRALTVGVAPGCLHSASLALLDAYPGSIMQHLITEPKDSSIIHDSWAACTTFRDLKLLEHVTTLLANCMLLAASGTQRGWSHS